MRYSYNRAFDFHYCIKIKPIIGVGPGTDVSRLIAACKWWDEIVFHQFEGIVRCWRDNNAVRSILQMRWRDYNGFMPRSHSVLESCLFSTPPPCRARLSTGRANHVCWSRLSTHSIARSVVGWCWHLAAWRNACDSPLPGEKTQVPASTVKVKDQLFRWRWFRTYIMIRLGIETTPFVMWSRVCAGRWTLHNPASYWQIYLQL